DETWDDCRWMLEVRIDNAHVRPLADNSQPVGDRPGKPATVRRPMQHFDPRITRANGRDHILSAVSAVVDKERIPGETSQRGFDFVEQRSDAVAFIERGDHKRYVHTRARVGLHWLCRWPLTMTLSDRGYCP